RPVGIIRRTVITNKRRAAQQGAGQYECSGDPPHVGWPAVHITWLDIKMDQGVMSDLDGKAAVRVYDAFRLACRAGGVDHHKRRVGRYRQCVLPLPVRTASNLLPVQIASVLRALTLGILPDYAFQQG